MKQNAKILLVDDEPGMLRYIKTLLEVTTTRSKPQPPARKRWSACKKACSPISSCSMC